MTPSRKRLRRILAAAGRLPGGGSPILLFTDLGSLGVQDPLSHAWMNGLGEAARLAD